MVKSIVTFLLVIGAVTITGQEATAIRYCPPIPVQVVGPFASCKCAVQNYSTAADTGVTISVYAVATATRRAFTTFKPSMRPLL